MGDFAELFTTLFTQGETIQQQDQVLDVDVVTVGELSLPSGSIIACDPLIAGRPRPFIQTVLPGRYPVELALLRSSSGETVAMARVTFTAGHPSIWVRAEYGKDDAGAPKGARTSGFRSESGTAAFMDAGAASLAEFSKLDDIDNLLIDLTANYRPHRFWLEQPLDRRHNIVMFSSGKGEGTYSSHFGIDDQGDTCVLVTDFNLLSK